MLDASEVHLEYIGLMHPHVPIYLLAPFYYLPGLATPAAPYLLSVLCGGLLLAIWNYHLRLKRYGARSRALLLAAGRGESPVSVGRDQRQRKGPEPADVLSVLFRGAAHPAAAGLPRHHHAGQRPGRLLFRR